MTEQEKKELQERVKSVIERVNNAAVQAGRDPSEITLVAATKMNDAERVQAAIEAGIRVCGETVCRSCRKSMNRTPTMAQTFSLSARCRPTRSSI